MIYTNHEQMQRFFNFLSFEFKRILIATDVVLNMNHISSRRSIPVKIIVQKLFRQFFGSYKRGVSIKSSYFAVVEKASVTYADREERHFHS